MADKFALVSVSNKEGLGPLVRALVDHGYEILSTGGTAKHLREEGLLVTDVAEVTGFPEILDGRVKTLHPVIHAGILARRDLTAHRKTLAQHEIPFIDVVVANLYPFSTVVARTETTHELALENIDIGGPTMVRGAAKNYPWVTVVVDPSDYDRIIEELTDEGVKPETRRELACKAFAHTARYDAMISDYLSAPSGPTSQTPARFDVTLEKLADLRYGENPHQHAAVYRRDEALSLGGLVQLHGKDLSYNNVVDLDAACGLVAEFDAPAAAVIKHTNPAGCATATDVDAAFHAALACDPTSAFGGIIVVNRALTEAVARTISESFFEIVAAPSFAPEAVSLLSKKRNLRLLTLPNTLDNGGWQFRQTALGWLVQEADTSRALDRESVVVPTKRAPTDAELRDLFFAWRVCKHVKSNAIVIAASEATLGIGAGQMSRIDSVETATRKAGTSTRGAVMASDAFFPFRDGPDAAAAAGITAIIQPGGSVRDEEVIAACDEHGIAMVFTERRHFRH